MNQTLEDIAQQLQGADKKVQLIYAFNGTGKTRLSRIFKELVAPKGDDVDEAARQKILYYNAFTEDLFYWDNDLEGDAEPKLMIQPNSFTDWILGEQGQGNEIISNFQHYTDDKLTPVFLEQEVMRNDQRVPTYPEVSFSFQRGDDAPSSNIKISKGEESNFIWSVFYTLMEQVIETLSVPEVDDRETDQFNDLSVWPKTS